MKGDYVLPEASINSIYVDDTKAYNLFRPTLLIDEILKQELVYVETFSQKDILSEFDKLLGKNNKDAIKIASHFAENFTSIIKTLHQPSEQSMKNRSNWTKTHWDFWKTITSIIFVGGMTTNHFSQFLQNYINNELQKEDIHLHCTFISNSGNYGIQGLALQAQNKAVLFDFGQTSIKRGFIEDSIFHPLEPVLSEFLDYKELTDTELEEEAHLLNNFIVDTIIATLKDKKDVNEIHISVANYINNGAIYPSRGAYGKLYLVSKNYEDYLNKIIREKTNSNIRIYLYHDTTAMGLNFKNLKNTAVISLGTAFGVAFPK